MRVPTDFGVTGVMSLPRLDFEMDLSRELTSTGATLPAARAYAEGLQRGGAPTFATGPEEKVATGGNIMNRLGAAEVEDFSGPGSQLTGVTHKSMTPMRDGSAMAGRIRQPGLGACFLCDNPHNL
jgi:hypothetical protein